MEHALLHIYIRLVLQYEYVLSLLLLQVLLSRRNWCHVKKKMQTAVTRVE